MQLLFNELCRRAGKTPPFALVVSVGQQRLGLFRDGALATEWLVSTSKFGVGNQRDSNRTPLGLHRIAEKIGAGAPLGTVFKSRQPVGLLTDNEFRITNNENLITTRILWLDGCEDGVNRGGDVDSHDRYIYIHGTNREDLIGTPASHGCVCLRNADVAALFELVEEGTPVMIG